MSSDSKAMVRALYDEVLNPRNLDDFDARIADPELAERIRQGCLMLYGAFPDMHSSIDDMVVEGDKVALRATSTGTHDGEWMGVPATGRHIAFEYAEIYRIADGKVVEYWCLPDMGGLMRQLTEEPVPVT
jgi:predicted ester cyclase